MNHLHRRTFLKMFGMGIATLGAGTVFARDEKPQFKNVLLLYVDDLRPEINCYGKSKLVTPNIDRLAGRSLVFNKAYCQVPICMPSRVSTLSGMYARKTSQGTLRSLLPQGKPSLLGHFMASGYDTISIGKVYHFNDDDPESWTKRYTDTFHEKRYVCDGWSAGYQLEENRKGRTYAKTGRNSSAITECVDAPDNAYPDGVSADNAIGELKKYNKSKKPFFLATGFFLRFFGRGGRSS